MPEIGIGFRVGVHRLLRPPSYEAVLRTTLCRKCGPMTALAGLIFAAGLSIAVPHAPG